MKKKVLSFDLTGTLATFGFCDSIYFEGLPGLYSEKHGIGFEESKHHLIAAYNAIGDQEADWYDLKYWFNRFDLGDGWDSLMADLSHNISFYPESVSVLASLSEKYELILISNACREFLEVETTSIKKFFTRMISCVSDFGEVKKTASFYARICTYLERDPQEIIHIGDNWMFDYVAPTKCGITSFYLDRTREKFGEYVIHDLSEGEARLI